MSYPARAEGLSKYDNTDNDDNIYLGTENILIIFESKSYSFKIIELLFMNRFFFPLSAECRCDKDKCTFRYKKTNPVSSL